MNSKSFYFSTRAFDNFQYVWIHAKEDLFKEKLGTKRNPL